MKMTPPSRLQRIVSWYVRVSARHPVLILLALGTFVAGVHARVWRICMVGVFLAASVPAVAWIQESAMLLLVAALSVTAIGLAFWWLWRRESGRP